MMKYYYLSVSVDYEEVGTYPQSTSCKSIGNIQEYGMGFNAPITNITLPELVLEKQTRLTDILSVTYIDRSVFLVVNDRFLSLFKHNFKINDFQYWSLEVFKNGNIVDNYNLFHLSYPYDENIIDFEKSKFKIKDISNNILKEKKYTNYHNYETDWKKLIWEGSVITFDTLYLDFSGLNLDLIRIIDIDSIGIGYYVSEKLKRTIEEQRFTGFAFQEIEEMDKRIKVIY